MKQFIYDVKNYGCKIALDNWLITFTFGFIKAKKITITY